MEDPKLKEEAEALAEAAEQEEETAQQEGHTVTSKEENKGRKNGSALLPFLTKKDEPVAVHATTSASTSDTPTASPTSTSASESPTAGVANSTSTAAERYPLAVVSTLSLVPVLEPNYATAEAESESSRAQAQGELEIHVFPHDPEKQERSPGLRSSKQGTTVNPTTACFRSSEKSAERGLRNSRPSEANAGSTGREPDVTVVAVARSEFELKEDLSSSRPINSKVKSSLSSSRNRARNAPPVPAQRQPTAASANDMSQTSVPGAVAVGFTGSRRPVDPVIREDSTTDTFERTNASAEGIVTAVTVEESQLEEEIRRRILHEAVSASSVHPVSERTTGVGNWKEWLLSRRKLLAFLVMVLVLVFVLAVSLVAAKRKEDEDDSTITIDGQGQDAAGAKIPTLDLIRKRGFIRCGVMDPVGLTVGTFVVDYCKAFSLAIFGVPDNTELFITSFQDSYATLVNGTYDVCLVGLTHTMERDVYQPVAQEGFTFTTPFHYSGMTFMGLPEYVECAENLDSFQGICRGLSVCVSRGSTHEITLENILPGGGTVKDDSHDEQFENFISGSCNVIAASPVLVSVDQFRARNYTGPFQFGTKAFSKESTAIASRKDDPYWSNFINFVVNIIDLAEHENITSSSADELYPILDQAGISDELASNMVSIIATLGNYGEIHERNEKTGLPPRQVINGAYHSSSESEHGVLFSFPFGNVETHGPAPLPGSALDKILSRGYLTCGILQGRAEDGFARSSERNTTAFENSTDIWSGMDVEFCQLLSAAIFAGDKNAIEFVEVKDTLSYQQALDLEYVDVVAGARVTLMDDFRGYKFSSPYYYDMDSGDAFGIAMTEADPQFGDFVYWVIMGVIYAEEEGIAQETSAEMPIISLFGETLKQMLRDAVGALGSYGEIYNRSLPDRPRIGANLLNLGPDFGPQHFPLPLH